MTPETAPGKKSVWRNPVTVSCAALFLAALVAIAAVTTFLSRREARARLRAASEDMYSTICTCADNLLFYQGQTIVGHYRKPEAMTCETVQQLMSRYGLDELNVVDSRGIVLAGALADVGYDMRTNPKTAMFNCLLAGARTYSQDFRAPVENPRGDRRKYAGVAFPWPAKGYIQMGFDERRLKDGLDFWFEDAAVDWHIGRSGYYIIADAESGYIRSCGRRDPESGEQVVRRGIYLPQTGLNVSALPKDPHAFFFATIFGERCLCLSDVKCYHRVICAMPLTEAFGGGLKTIVVSAVALLAVFLLVVGFMRKLTDLVAALREKERAEKERQLKDLTLAKTIQTSALPFSFPEAPDYAVCARMDTAREVGGDFYDFHVLPSGRLLFLVADVSGKGIPAALFMMRAKATLLTAVQENDELAAAVAAANDVLAVKNDAEMFVTAWVGVYDRATGEVTFVNAGHNPPLVRHPDGTTAWVRERSGLVLAAMPGSKYRPRRLRLDPGDTLFLYTDGVTEAMNPAAAQYGEARLEKKLSAVSDGNYVESIRADVTAFVAGAEPSDDVTMLAFRRLAS